MSRGTCAGWNPMAIVTSETSIWMTVLLRATRLLPCAYGAQGNASDRREQDAGLLKPALCSKWAERRAPRCARSEVRRHRQRGRGLATSPLGYDSIQTQSNAGDVMPTLLFVWKVRRRAIRRTESFFERRWHLIGRRDHDAHGAPVEYSAHRHPERRRLFRSKDTGRAAATVAQTGVSAGRNHLTYRTGG